MANELSQEIGGGTLGGRRGFWERESIKKRVKKENVEEMNRGEESKAASK